MFAISSKARLTPFDLGRFPDESLLHRVARAVCRAECLPRKELFEAWEVARRVRRRFRGGRVVDLAAGHGLLAHLMLLLDDSSPNAIAIDTALPPSRAKLHDVLVDAPLAIDLKRAARLEQRGHQVWTQTIPADITPKNRLLMGSMLNDQEID